MVGAFPSQIVGIPSTDETQYYLLATVNAQKWGNYRCSFSVNSRHSGCGMVTIAFGNNTSDLVHKNMYAQIYYFGTTNQVSDSQIFQVYGSADGQHYYLFAKSWDYNSYNIAVFTSDFALSRGSALTSIPTNTYGTLLCNTTINPSNSVSWNNISEKPSTYTPSSHTHPYLPTAGGNMTGNIGYAGSKATYSMIRFINNTVDTYGNGISIGGGGLTVIGGGKSATVIEGQHTTGGDENMVIANDGAIDFYTNCQEGFSKAKHIAMNADGSITASAFHGNASSASSVPWSGVTGKPSTYAPSSHTHDDRYYTESEMNTKLNAKAASDVVTISSTKPTSNTCKIWIKI